MDHDKEVEENIRKSGKWNNPGTAGQDKALKDEGEDPANYRNRMGEKTKAIAAARRGDPASKISNHLRKGRKWLEDDF